ncbi:hypothetical protein [Arcticibacterium luteifluviistationis]|nr:hypothetical protein [Arcticibacterium luteifluviistationis]
MPENFEEMAILLRGHETGEINWQVDYDAGYQVIILMIVGAIIGAWA